MKIGKKPKDPKQTVAYTRFDTVFGAILCRRVVKRRNSPFLRAISPSENAFRAFRRGFIRRIPITFFGYTPRLHIL